MKEFFLRLPYRATILYLLIILVSTVLFVSCTHLPKPDRIVSETQSYLDWNKNPPQAPDRARHTIEGERLLSSSTIVISTGG